MRTLLPIRRERRPALRSGRPLDSAGAGEGEARDGRDQQPVRGARPPPPRGPDAADRGRRVYAGTSTGSDHAPDSPAGVPRARPVEPFLARFPPVPPGRREVPCPSQEGPRAPGRRRRPNEPGPTLVNADGALRSTGTQASPAGQ
ncbi:hypothetical protein Sdia_25510 [Streptomyces diastaticus subsp. diastaticus]|uniref:Uncharacterized protein n=1 Tax=Streptomyces diastaticus subsp. diastaticus TaxID=68040 RepID=A0ABQ1CND2_STRDI|nr:hypothetical protein Sdia_25510 [Streptomyces diastaticus subsp. diastaticus]GGU47366.1 hypothetical protein GCM10015534_57290 [Streptomyces diastaticus subsp. diastaticus]